VVFPVLVLVALQHRMRSNGQGTSNSETTQLLALEHDWAILGLKYSSSDQLVASAAECMLPGPTREAMVTELVRMLVHPSSLESVLSKLPGDMLCGTSAAGAPGGSGAPAVADAFDDPRRTAMSAFMQGAK
jgi:hypothetical protein